MRRSRQIGFVLGLAFLLLLLFLPTPEGARPEAMRAAGVTLLMATWWVSEALPISATSFVPLVLFPLLGILDAESTARNYGHNYVLMLLGGFFIARAIEVQNLHRRIALFTLSVLGHSRRRIILSFMLATAFLSMWIANVAVTLLMLPIAVSIIAREEVETSQNNHFGLALMLSIAYAASIGGTTTLIGTPPNLVFAGMIPTLYPNAPPFSFLDWLKIGVPLVVVCLPMVWFYMISYFRVRGSFPGSRELIHAELAKMGPMTPGEKRVFVIFALTALGWISRQDIDLGSIVIPGWSSLLGVEDLVHDSTVAMAAALLLFMIPSGRGEGRLLTWHDAEKVPWGVVIIVGGGYAIANGFTATGLSSWIGQEISFITNMPTFLLLLAVVFFVTFLTEINSNTATANIFLPVLGTMALVSGAHPYLLMLPATIACSFAFCLPSGTGSNAVVFASGRVSIPEMARCGFLLNFIAIALVTLIVYLVAVPIFDLAGGAPSWTQTP